MKKVIFLAVVLVALMVLPSCDKPVQDGASLPDGQESVGMVGRTMDISDGINGEQSKFSYSFDMDSDGTDDELEIRVASSQSSNWAGCLVKVCLGSYESVIETDSAIIEKVYVCDIDTTDELLDLALITTEWSSDPVLYLFKYDTDLPRYDFKLNFDSSLYNDDTYDSNGLGYACSFYFNVNDDGSITLEEQTSSAGMWSVYKTYRLDENGAFKEEKPEYYEVLPDFMEKSYYFENELIGSEKKKWAEGYIKSYTTFTSYGFTVYDGEYFRVLYDDGDNNLYIQKENGEAAWINIHYNNSYRNAINNNFFYLAG